MFTKHCLCKRNNPWGEVLEDMETAINSFMIYLHNIKKTSENTEQSYRRDLMKVKQYMEEQGITDVKKINATNLNSYILYLEKNKFSAATISSF